MIKTTEEILKDLSDYASPRCRLQRLVDEGVYHPIIRGLYETDPDTPGQCFSSVIRSPSYLSFGYALSRHGMVPDAERVFTSATRSTHRTKRYETPFGTFTYRDVPVSVFGYEVNLETERGYQVWMASPEKALCDQLYIMKPVRSARAIAKTVYDDLRVHEWATDRLDMDVLRRICPLYRSSNTDLFLRMMERD